MRYDFRGLILFALAWLFTAITWMILFSCSASYHLQKFQSKGGICGKIDTIRVQRFDTITNTFYYYDSLTIVNDRVVPLTRTEIRYKERERRDTINHKETIIKYLTKQEKTKAKASNTDALSRLLWVFVFVGVVIAVIIYLIKRK
jgi:hypothetical protein